MVGMAPRVRGEAALVREDALLQHGREEPERPAEDALVRPRLIVEVEVPGDGRPGRIHRHVEAHPCPSSSSGRATSTFSPMILNASCPGRPAGTSNDLSFVFASPIVMLPDTRRTVGPRRSGGAPRAACRLVEAPPAGFTLVEATAALLPATGAFRAPPRAAPLISATTSGLFFARSWRSPGSLSRIVELGVARASRCPGS